MRFCFGELLIKQKNAGIFLQMQNRARAWIATLFCLLVAQTSVHADPVENIVIDPFGTIYQLHQDYEYVNGKKRPLLRYVNFNSRTVYLRPDALNFLRYLIEERSKGSLKGIHFVSSTHHQKSLNAVLAATRIGGKTLLEIADTVFGAEAVKAYWKLIDGGKTVKKDLNICMTGANREVSNALKTGNLDALKNLTKGRVSAPPRTFLVTNAPGSLNPIQAETAVQVSPFFARNEKFWTSYESAIDKPMLTPGSDLTTQKFLAELETERNQLSILKLLMETAKTSSLANPFKEWTSLLRAGSMLGIERANYNYLIPDLLLKDGSDVEFVFTGRDIESFYVALASAAKQLGVQGKLIYVPISRLSAKEEQARLLDVLAAYGADVESIKLGKKKLYTVDTNHVGSIQRAILTAFVPLNDPEWRTKVKKIRTILFNPARTSIAPPEEFATYEQYLLNGAFIDHPVHQDRLDYSYMRRLTGYLDLMRPKPIVRTIFADEEGKLVTRPNHPTESRFWLVLEHFIKQYYGNPTTVALLKQRLQFLQNPAGIGFPNLWKSLEPPPPIKRPLISEADLPAVMAVGRAHHFHIFKEIENTFRHTQKFESPKVVPHHQKPRAEKEIEHFQYAPSFAKGDPVDLAQPFLDLPVLTESEQMKLWPKLDVNKFEKTREAGLKTLSRNINGRAGNPGKKLALQGDALAQATIDANRAVSQALLRYSRHHFTDSDEIAKFIINEIAIPYIKPVREIKDETSIWRTWNFQNEAQKKTGNYHANHPVQQLEKDWIWFTDWYVKNLGLDYDPIDFAARIHEYFANNVHPFADGVGKVTRDLMDFAFIRKGYMPINWTRITFEEYWEASGSMDSMKKLIQSKTNITCNTVVQKQMTSQE